MLEAMALRLVWAAVWTVSSLAEVSAVSAVSSSLWAAAWSQNGDRVATGGDAGDLRIWRASGSTLVELGRLRGHSGPVYAVSWSLEGTRLISGGSDGSVRIWNTSGNDPSSWSELRTLEHHIFSVRVTLWSPCGDRVLSGGDGFKVRIWNVADQSPSLWSEAFSGSAGVVQAAAWSPDCSSAITGGFNELHVWRSGFAKPQVIRNEHGWVRATAWAPGNTLIAAGDDKGILHVWRAPGADLANSSFLAPARDSPQWEELRQLRVPSAKPITAAAWSPHTHEIVVGTEDGYILVWDLQRLDSDELMAEDVESFRPQVLQRADGAISALSWSPDASVLLVASYNGMGLWCHQPGGASWQSCSAQQGGHHLRRSPSGGDTTYAWGLLLLLVCVTLQRFADCHGCGKDKRGWRSLTTCGIIFGWTMVVFGLCNANPWLHSKGVAAATAIEQGICRFFAALTRWYSHNGFSAAARQEAKRVTAWARHLPGTALSIVSLGVPISDEQPWWMNALLRLGVMVTLLAPVWLWCMLRCLWRGLRRLSHPGAFFAITAGVLASVCGLLLLSWWGLTRLFGHTATWPRFTIAPLAPPMFWIVVHAGSFFTTVGRVLVFIFLRLRTLVYHLWQFIMLFKHFLCFLKAVVPHGAAEVAAQTMTDVSHSQPLLEKAGLRVIATDATPKEWAAALIEVMHRSDKCAFYVDANSDIYKELDEALNENGCTSIKDLLCFPPMYIRCLAINLQRCFYRQLWIDNVLPQLRERQKELAKDMEKMASETTKKRYQHWQVLEDQIMWYHNHSLVLVDVLGLLTARNSRMGGVARVWKALDDAISSLLPRLLFPRLWRPTPSVRRQALLSRMGNVSILAAGGELRSGSVAEVVDCRLSLAGSQQEKAEPLTSPRNTLTPRTLKRENDSLKAKVNRVQNLAKAAISC